MTKQEFLSASLPYNLNVRNKGYKNPRTIDGIYSDGTIHLMEINRVDLFISDIVPIILHPDMLIQECVQADYNGGNPFIPMIELGWPDSTLGWGTSNLLLALRKEALKFEEGIKLIKWHFWPNMPEGEEVVYVTEDFNPYK